MGAELRVFINKIARTGLNYFLESSVGVFLLEQDLEQVLTGDSLRWLPIETLETNGEEIIQALDSECHVPRPVTVLTGRRADWYIQTEAITLEARIAGGRLRLSPPLTGLICVQGDHIYLEDGRQLQIALASAPMPESQRG